MKVQTESIGIIGIVGRMSNSDLANNHNTPIFLDIIDAIRKTDNGVFTCTLRIVNGFITDFVENKNVE